MNRIFVVLVITLLIVCISTPIFADSSGVLFSTWLGSHTSCVLINPHWGYGGPGIGNSWHYNLHIYHHPRVFGVQKYETNNLHISFYGRSGQKCIYIWDNYTNWQPNYCIGGGKLSQVAQAVQNAVYATTGIVIAWWLAYVIAGLMAPLALA